MKKKPLKPPPDIRRQLLRPVPILFTLILLLAGVLRFWDLGGKSFWVDEVIEAEVVGTGFRACVHYAWQDVTPPLHYLLNVIPYKIWPNEFGLRFMTALAGIGGVALIFFVLKNWTSTYAALAGMFLLAVNQEHIHHSQDARMYAWMILFSLFATWAIDRVVQGCRRNEPAMRMVFYTFLFVLATLLNVYNSYFAFFLLAAHLPWAAFIIVRTTPRGLRLAALLWPAMALCVILAAYVPWMPALLQLVKKEVTHSTASGLSQMVEVAQAALLAWGGRGWFLGLPAFLAGLVCMIRKDWPRAALILIAMAIPEFYLMNARTEHFFDTRYILFLLPLGIITIAYAFEALEQRLSSCRLRIAGIVCLLLVLSVPAILGLPGYYRAEKQNWRDAAAFVIKNLQPNDLIVTGINAADAAVVHYFWRSGFSVEVSPKGGEYRVTRGSTVAWIVGHVRQPVVLDTQAKKYKMIWYVGAHLNDARSQPVLEWFREKATPAWQTPSLTDWGVIEIYRYPKEN